MLSRVSLIDDVRFVAGPVTVARAALVACVVLALPAHPSASQPGSARVATSGDRELVSFLETLNRAASARDRAGFAALVHFPISVQASGLAIPIADTREFLRYYDSVVTEGVIDAIGQALASARTRSNDSRRLVVGDDGVFVGGRTLVIRRVEGRLRVVQMTVVMTTTRWQAATRDVQVIAFRRGEPPAKRRGALARGERESHVLYVPSGRLLVARVDEVRATDVVLELTDSTGAALDTRAGRGVRAWTGRIRKDTDVRITVVRRGGQEPVLGYLLTVDVR